MVNLRERERERFLRSSGKAELMDRLAKLTRERERRGRGEVDLFVELDSKRMEMNKVRERYRIIREDNIKRVIKFMLCTSND